MAPVRVALIGLSSAAKTSWAADAHLPYLLSERGQKRYQLVALLNSSAARAEEAKTSFRLPAAVKAYGTPEDLANDPNVDLVVCNTRVDTHYDAVLPSVKAGKAVFVEWPLAHSLEKASELLKAQKHPVSIVGVQGRMLPAAATVRRLLRGGAIGDVLSSFAQYFGNLTGAPDAYSEGLSYFADRSVGGNPSNIAFAHSLDIIHHTLGEYESFVSRLQIQRPRIRILGAGGKQVGTVTSDVPDLITLAGPLSADRKGASLTLSYRNGPPFPGSPGMVWTINGEKGEIRFTAPGPYVQSETQGDEAVVELHDFESNTVSKIAWEWEDWQKTLPVRARNVGEMYERISRCMTGESSVQEEDLPSFAHGVRRHEQLAEMYWQFDNA